jgi:hypothetical protein
MSTKPRMRLHGPSRGVLEWTAYIEARVEWLVRIRKQLREGDRPGWRIPRGVLISLALVTITGARLAGLL